MSEDDSQEERERKERIPQRKADISRCWSKYCLDLLKCSRDKCVQELRGSDQGDEDQNREQGVKMLFVLLLLFLRFSSLVDGLRCHHSIRCICELYIDNRNARQLKKLSPFVFISEPKLHFTVLKW